MSSPSKNPEGGAVLRLQLSTTKITVSYCISQMGAWSRMASQHLERQSPAAIPRLQMNYICFRRRFLKLSPSHLHARIQVHKNWQVWDVGCAAPNCCTAPTYGLIPVQPPAILSSIKALHFVTVWMEKILVVAAELLYQSVACLFILLHDSDLIDNLSGLSANLVTKQ
jgi:hypothetical protein